MQGSAPAGAEAHAHSSTAEALPAPTAVLSRTVLLSLVYHAHPRGKVGSATAAPSYVFPAAAAARWHAAASTIRVAGAGQSLLPLTPHVYAPASSTYA